MDSPRRPGQNGEGDEEARDGMGPLHLAATWGLDKLVQCLLEFNANVNAQVQNYMSQDLTFLYLVGHPYRSSGPIRWSPRPNVCGKHPLGTRHPRL